MARATLRRRPGQRLMARAAFAPGDLAGDRLAGSLRDFIGMLEREHPDQIVHVGSPVNPAAFEVTAVLKQLELRRKYPLVLFERPLDLYGNESGFRLATNIYATRERCALSPCLRRQDALLGLSLEYAKREERRIAPEPVHTADP